MKRTLQSKQKCYLLNVENDSFEKETHTTRTFQFISSYVPSITLRYFKLIFGPLNYMFIFLSLVQIYRFYNDRTQNTLAHFIIKTCPSRECCEVPKVSYSNSSLPTFL